MKNHILTCILIGSILTAIIALAFVDPATNPHPMETRSLIVSSASGTDELDGLLAGGWQVTQTCPMGGGGYGYSPCCLVVVRREMGGAK